MYITSNANLTTLTYINILFQGVEYSYNKCFNKSHNYIRFVCLDIDYFLGENIIKRDQSWKWAVILGYPVTDQIGRCHMTLIVRIGHECIASEGQIFMITRTLVYVILSCNLIRKNDLRVFHIGL